MAREIPFPITLDELPPAWREAAAHITPAPLEPELVLYLPAHTMSLLRRGRVPAQALLFSGESLIHVVEEEGVTARQVRAAETLAVRHTLVLLYGRLELYPRSETPLVIEYNTIAERYVHRPLQTFIRAMAGQAKGRDALTQDLLHTLEKQSFKLKNGLDLYALLPDEPLLAYVWQPRVTGLLGRVRLPAAVLALTPHYVLHVSEARAKGAAYGWSIGVYPRRWLADEQLVLETPWARIQWGLGHPGEAVRFEAQLQPQVAQAWSALAR